MKNETKRNRLCLHVDESNICLKIKKLDMDVFAPLYKQSSVNRILLTRWVCSLKNETSRLHQHVEYPGVKTP